MLFASICVIYGSFDSLCGGVGARGGAPHAAGAISRNGGGREV
jgi:hypothetical protein